MSLVCSASCLLTFCRLFNPDSFWCSSWLMVWGIEPGVWMSSPKMEVWGLKKCLLFFPQALSLTHSHTSSHVFLIATLGDGYQFSSAESLSHVWLFAIPWTAARQASLSITNSWSLLKLMSTESVMPSNHLILSHPLLPPSIFPSARVFFNVSALHIRWPEYWSFSFSISPSSEYPGLISFRMDWLDLLAVQETLKSLL